MAPANKCFINGERITGLRVKELKDIFIDANLAAPAGNKDVLVEALRTKILALCPAPDGDGKHSFPSLLVATPAAASGPSSAARPLDAACCCPNARSRPL